MAEKRQKTASILLRFPGKKNGKTRVIIDLFASEQWRGGKEGSFRVKMDGKWLDAPKAPKLFVPLARIGKLLAEQLAAILGAPWYERAGYERMPFLPWKSEVSIPALEEWSAYPETRGTTMAPVHQGADGRWMVWVYVPTVGPVHVPASDATLIRRSPYHRDPYADKTRQEESPCRI